MISEELNELARQIREEKVQPQETVRNLLAWFNAKRRGYYVVATIRQALAESNLITEPDFESTYIDSLVEFVSVEDKAPEGNDEDRANKASDLITTNQNNNAEAANVEFVSGAIADPTFRVGQLKSANTSPVAVNPGASLAEAITLMMMHDFSQLPVVQEERFLKGMVSWESIGKRLALKRPCENVRDCMAVNVPEVPANTFLFTAIDLIIGHGYVLVRGDDKKISGIVTTSDLSLEFRLLAEPFLLIGEIENYVRQLINKKFTTDQLRSIRDPSDERSIETVADLSFGEYVRLLETPEHWANLNLAISRNVFTKWLDRVRELRNDVMHFNPDPFLDEDINLLRKFVRFMRDLIVN